MKNRNYHICDFLAHQKVIITGFVVHILSNSKNSFGGKSLIKISNNNVVLKTYYSE